MNKFFIILMFFSMTDYLYSQKSVTTEFYKLKIPKDTNVKIFAQTHEKLANIDAYQFITKKKPKYILYLISNKTTKKVNINNDNYKEFLGDLGDLKIDEIEKNNNKYKIHFSYVNKKNVKGVLYISVNHNILNRFIFLFPNDIAQETFQKETMQIMKSIHHLRDYW